MLEGENDPDTWELSKENILPLKQGRKANVLSVALDESATRKLSSMRHEFEEELRTYSGDDPLDVWYRYSMWVEQNYPKGGKDGNLKKLIEKCVTSIHVNTETNEKYKNDSRLLTLWVKYANLCPNPLDIYLALEGKGLCVGLAEYYISWSWEFEKVSNFRRAESIYQKGIQAGAQPFDVLQDAYKKFQTRVARATIEGSIPEPETDDPQRVALTALKVKGRKNRVANERVGSSVLGPAGRVPHAQPASNAGGPTFSIYQDNGNVAPSAAGVPAQGGSLPARSTINKENVKDPVQWTKVKVNQKTTGVVSVEDINKGQKPAFSFHQDEGTSQHGKTPSKLPETSNVLSVRKKEFDEWQVPLFVAEPFDPKVQPQYCKQKVYCGTEEFSFEELRAAKEFKKEREEREKKKFEEEKNAQIQQMQEMLKKQEEMIQQLLQSQITQQSQERQHQQNRDRSNYQDSWICMNKSVTASINHSVNVSNFLDESSTRALLQLKPATLTPVSLEPLAEQDHSALARVTNVSGQDSSNTSHSNSRGLNLTDPTVNTKIAMNAVHDMWSASLFKDDIIATSEDVSDASAPKESAPFTIYQDNTSNKQEQACIAQKPTPQPFAIYCDNGENNQEEAKPSQPFTIFQDEPVKAEVAGSADPNDMYPQNQDENRPPEGLKPNKEIRPLAGVLQVATNVPFTPLEDQKMEDVDGTNKGDDGTSKKDDGGSNKEELNYDDDFEDIVPLNGTSLADFTLKMPTNPEAFAKFAKVASTPAPWGLEQVQQPTVTGSDCTVALLKGSSHFPLIEENVEEDEKKEQSSVELMPPPTVQPMPATPPEAGTKPGLSPIMEASREYRSSSSSSGYSTTCTTLGTNSTQGFTQCGVFSTTQNSRSRHNSHTQVESVLYTDGNCQAGDFTKSGYLADKSRGESLAEPRQNNATSQNNIPTQEEELTFDPRQAAAMLLEMDGMPMVSAPARVDYREPKELGLSREPKECGSDKLSKFKFPEKINPFEEELLGTLLSGLEEKLEARGGFVQMSGKLPVIKPGMQISLGHEMFHVRRLRGEGAYAKVYQAATVDPMNVTIFPTGDDDDDDEEEDDELQMILKVQKPACQWEFYICHELRQRLKAKSYPVNMLDSVMRINRGYFYPNGSILVNQYHKYGTLLDVVNGYKTAGQSLPEELIIFFMIEVISIVEALHKCQIIHADVKPDNFLVRDIPSINISATTPEEMFESSPDSLKLIDFGRSIDMKLLPEGTTFTEKVTTEGFTCCEMRDGRPWTYQTDLYGIAAIAYCFLFGSYMEVKKGPSGKWEPKGVTMKRYWKKDLWQSMFSTLLNVSSCSALPSLSKLKQEMMTKFFESRMQKEINVKFKWLTSILTQRK